MGEAAALCGGSTPQVFRQAVNMNRQIGQLILGERLLKLHIKKQQYLLRARLGAWRIRA